MIEHCAIWGALEQLNFGPKIIKMIRTLFSSFCSFIESNGYISDSFPITRSVHQGSPISSYLFLITGQLLTYLVKSNSKLAGVSINNYKHVISQFADDTDLYLLFNQETIDQVISTLTTLENNVGFKVNYDKTTIYRMGSIEKSNAKLYTKKVFQWRNEPPNILGVDIVQYGDYNAILHNFTPILEKVEAILNSWKNRNLSLSGKVLVINSLVASLFVYKMSVLPNVPYSVITQFQEIISKYLGNGKRLRIPLKMLQAPRDLGGLQLVDLFSRQMALKAQWVVTVRDNTMWADIAYEYLDKHLKQKIWQCNIHVNDVDSIIPTASFWRQVLYAWCLYNFSLPNTSPLIRGEIIWFNSNIKVGGKVLRNINAWQNGLIYIADLCGPDGLFLSYRQLVQKFGPLLSWYEHIQIVSAIPHK